MIKAQSDLVRLTVIIPLYILEYMITTLLFKTDKKLKEAAQSVAREMGLPLSAFLNEQLRRLVDERKAEFRAPLVPNAKTARILRRRIADARAGRNMSPIFTEHDIDKMDAWLDGK